jgi:hypothetical protein
MGFMRPTGLTPQERAVMAQYPNLLSFDVETYVHTGNIRDAANVGLGRLGLMMAGQDAWGMPSEALSGIGSTLWSGDVFGLDLPNNPMDPLFDPLALPTQPTGSFISLSHAIKRTGALQCGDCHSPTGVMDFRALSYSASDITFLQSVLQDVPSFTVQSVAQGLKLSWYSIPGQTYQVQATTNLTQGTWLPMGSPMIATNQWLETVLPVSQVSTQRQMFFRVMTTTP